MLLDIAIGSYVVLSNVCPTIRVSLTTPLGIKRIMSLPKYLHWSWSACAYNKFSIYDCERTNTVIDYYTWTLVLPNSLQVPLVYSTDIKLAISVLVE